MSTQVDDVPAVRPAAAPPPAEKPELPLTVLLPPTGWQFINFAELWRFHELILLLAWRDVKVRYKQTLLGAAWAVLQPGMNMVVMTIFFNQIANVPAGEFADKYPLFVFAGLLPWSFFATAISNGGNSVIGSERLITKIYFPRLAIPLASVGAALVDFAVACGLLVVLMLWYQVPPGPGLLLAPLFVGLMTLAAIGVGTLLAALNVYYRDFRYVLPFLTQFWMYATPTVYMDLTKAAAGREWLQAVLSLNPMTPLIAGFRVAVLGRGTIDWAQVAVAAAVSALLFLGGCLYFRRVEDSFADVI